MSVCVQVAPPVAVTPVQAAPPVNVDTVHVGAPITLNATLGRAGLWTGQGPPGTIIGAAVGDEYLNDLNGDLFRLEPGA